MTEDDKKFINNKKILKCVGMFLDILQDRYSMNSFSPEDIKLSKNSNCLFVKVKDDKGEIILDTWEIDDFNF